MRFTFGKLSVLCLLACLSCLGQVSEGQIWEVGGSAGYSSYRNVAISAPAGQGKAGFAPGVIFSVFGGHNMYNHIGGEFRYTYTANDLKLSAAGTEARMNGDSQTFHYDFLFHAKKRASRVRPFLAAGAGAKLYRGTGTERAVQPLIQFAALTRTSEVQPLISIGGGVKYTVSSHVQLRVDFRDYVTPFPKKVVAPRSHSSLSGWLHDFTPTVGISYIF